MKVWKLAGVALAGMAGLVVVKRRRAGAVEAVRPVVTRRREAPRRADARRGLRAAPVRRVLKPGDAK
ncbi:hypothetical protein LZG04_05120 [Saccharothrix sp. S26]|uniref:hypothetical protein n=1 Tax=Saccharothrix sp. S26 TaxID=2907215 RepID=UPI001F47A615|nr:hypothetical protein [Saccharothrix sp. S26]MCE6994196.1 hypothetical protein [Saccharothrix sp. S26]